MVNKRATNKVMKALQPKGDVATVGGEPLIIPNHSGISSHPEFKKSISEIPEIFERTGTTITPKTQNDVLDMTSGTTTVNIPNITGTATATEESGWGVYGGTQRFRIYGYVEVDGVKYFSPNYLDTGDFTLSGSYCQIGVDWTDTTSTFDGYRVLVYDSYYGWNYNGYIDVATNDLTYQTYGSYPTSGSTVTPTSYTDYVTTYPILSNGSKLGKDGYIDGDLNVNGEQNITGDLNSLADINCSGNSNLGYINVNEDYANASAAYIRGTTFPVFTVERKGAFGAIGASGFRLYRKYTDTVVNNSGTGYIYSLDNIYGNVQNVAGIYGYWNNVTSFAGGLTVDIGISNSLRKVALFNRYGMTLQPWSASLNWAASGEGLNLLGDNYKLSLGAGKDAYIQYNGTDLEIKPDAVGSGAEKHLGDSYFSGSGSGLPFGEIYAAANTTASTISTQNVWYQFTGFNTNGQSNLTTPDHTNDHITITKAGIYKIDFNVSFSGGGGKTYEVAVYKNNGATELTNIHIERKLGTAGDIGSAAASGFCSCSANDTIELWIRCTDVATANATIRDANLNVLQVGG